MFRYISVAEFYSTSVLVFCVTPYLPLKVSEAGVHRPHVAGIAARENEGAFSIVLSGGYEDDVVRYLFNNYSILLVSLDSHFTRV